MGAMMMTTMTTMVTTMVVMVVMVTVLWTWTRMVHQTKMRTLAPLPSSLLRLAPYLAS